MRDNRKLKRRHLIYYLKVMDRDSDSLLGFLVDITTKGIMIMSEEPIKAGRIFHLKILLPTDDMNKKHLIFDAKSLWSEQSVNTDFYDTGFELINVNTKDFESIDKIIYKLGFND